MRALDRGALVTAAFLFLNLHCNYQQCTRQGMDGGVKLTCVEVNISQKYRRVVTQKPVMQLLTFVAMFSHYAKLFAF